MGNIDNILINKSETVRRCLRRIHEEYQGDPKNLDHITKQDSIVLNLQRACEACIDLAMHIVSERRLGVPQHSRDAFELLQRHGIINQEIADRLKAMVGFRNIAVHDYQSLRIEILQSILDKRLHDFEEFLKAVAKR